MRSIVVAISAIFLGGGACAGPLTYDAALSLAADTAPDLQAKVIEVKAARTAAVAAGRLPDPKLELGVEGFPVSGPLAFRPAADDFSDVKVGLMQDLPSGAKRTAARTRASADIDAADAARAVVARQVRLNTALAWIDLHFARQRLAALDEIDRALAPMRGAAPSGLASGALTPTQTLEPEQLTAVLADRRDDLVASVAKARAELVRWTGQADADVTGPPPDDAIDEVALRAGLDDIPALRAYGPMSRQAQADLQAAKADRRPDTSWELAWQHRDPRFGDMVMLQATIGLPIFAATRQDPIIAARAQSASGVLIEREAARRELAAALDSSLADHAMHHQRLMRAQQTLVPLADRRAHLEAASYAAGSVGLADVLAAFLALAEARIDLIDRQADVVRDGARIVLTYGSDPQ
jgi:outer membrane protein TolC